MLGKLVTIICEGGWKYTGKLIDIDATMFTRPHWFLIETKNAEIMVQASRIVSIIVNNNEKA